MSSRRRSRSSPDRSPGCEQFLYLPRILSLTERNAELLLLNYCLIRSRDL